ncbi:MAG: alanine racemase [Gammaproteobacteria bacterium]
MTPAAYAVLDLPAFRHNLDTVRSLAPAARIMAVIKANGYGHGLLRSAQALKKVDAFAVARVDEAVRLRQSGIDRRIAVLEGFCCREELDLLLEHGCEAVIHSTVQVDLLETSARARKLGVWLKLDTGMNRLGMNDEDFLKSYRRLEHCESVGSLALMTHLANADDQADDKTSEQISRFNRVAEGLPGERSIANSAGILGWPSSLADWVRPGVMLYGVSPFPEGDGRQLGLKPVMTLHSRLIAVKDIGKGEPVGYGGQWISDKPTRLGVAAIGYGDGYPRHAPPGTPVMVNGIRTPLVGRVSMDMITIDLSACPEAEIGDPVILWGDGLPVEEIARCASTIPYTLLCGITQRVQIFEE